MANSEWATGIREGCRTKTIRIGNCIVTVHRPIALPKEERRIIEDQVRVSMLGLLEENKKEKVS